MYGSNGASVGLPMGMTTLKGTTGTLGPLGNYGSGMGITGATTLPRPGNWLRPAGLRLGHSAARVRLYCQAKWGAMVPTGETFFTFSDILCCFFFLSVKKKKQILRRHICFYNFLTVRVAPGRSNGITTIFFFTSLCLSVVKERSHRYRVIKRNRKAITLLKI